MIDYISVDEHDPFQPHRTASMKLHGNMTGVIECNAITPTLYPKERPIGPHNVFNVDDPRPGDDLEEHASKVMSRIEKELAAKYHVDHVVDR